MNFRSKLLTIAAISAMGAATAVPAMALENEFHGMFGLRATTGNYNNGGAGGYLFAANGTGDGTTSKNWIEQRARLVYSAKANDSLKLVTAFELDSTWGKSSYTVSRSNDGGALGADTVNLETKWVYLDFNIPSTPVNVKAGIQGLNDAYKSVFVGGGSDAAGVLVSAPVGSATISGGWFRLDDRTVSAGTANGISCVDNATGVVTAQVAGACPAGTTGFVTSTGTNNNGGFLANTSGTAANITFTDGHKTRDLLLVDGKFNVNKDIKVGGSYYMLLNTSSQVSAAQASVPAGTVGSSTDYLLHVLGVNAAATFGPATFDGYVLYEFGNDNTRKTHINAFASNLGAKIKAGSSTIKAQALYVSGGTNRFYNINNETSGTFAENNFGTSFGNMFLLVRNTGNTTNDQDIVFESSNRGMGIFGGSLGIDTWITDKLFLNVNAGILAAAKKLTNNKYQGSEANLEVGYKLYDNMTASIQTAYLFLGDFYNNKGNNNTDPSNPYLGRIVLNYVF